MPGRFVSNLTLLVGGGVLAALALVLPLGDARWIALGVGCLTAAVVLLAFAWPGRGAGQRTIDVLAMAAAAWTIVASCSFDGIPLRWLSFGVGALLAMLGLTGLVLHEVLIERELRARRAEPRFERHVTPLPERIAAGAGR